MSKVSVLVPVYNAEKYIRQCIESVLNQTYPNVELILVDDGSKDNSLEICRFYEGPRVKVVTQTNKGACAARNLALTLATGDYIQYLDADDYIDKHKIKAQMAARSPGAGENEVLSGKMVVLNDNTSVPHEVEGPLFANFSNPRKWLLSSWLGLGMFSPNVWLIPRKLIEKAGAWNERLHLNQDGDFFARVLMLASNINYCSEAVAYYRKDNINSISRSGTNSLIKAKSLLTSYKNYIDYAQKYQFVDELKKGLANNLLSYQYIYYDTFPQLCADARRAFNCLGYTSGWPVGGANFRRLASLLGFKNALRLRSLTRKLFSK